MVLCRELFKSFYFWCIYILQNANVIRNHALALAKFKPCHQKSFNFIFYFISLIIFNDNKINRLRARANAPGKARRFHNHAFKVGGGLVSLIFTSLQYWRTA